VAGRHRHVNVCRYLRESNSVITTSFWSVWLKAWLMTIVASNLSRPHATKNHTKTQNINGAVHTAQVCGLHSAYNGWKRTSNLLLWKRVAIPLGISAFGSRKSRCGCIMRGQSLYLLHCTPMLSKLL
jgi:hypothetical protein